MHRSGSWYFALTCASASFGCLQQGFSQAARKPHEPIQAQNCVWHLVARVAEALLLEPLLQAFGIARC
jgi:hypothetical protein